MDLGNKRCFSSTRCCLKPKHPAEAGWQPVPKYIYIFCNYASLVGFGMNISSNLNSIIAGQKAAYSGGGVAASKVVSVNSEPQKLNFNSKNKAILFLPSVQDTLNRIGDYLVKDLFHTVMMDDDYEENIDYYEDMNYSDIQRILKNRSNFYKELVTTLNSLESGSYKLEFYFYTHNIKYPTILKEFYYEGKKLPDIIKFRNENSKEAGYQKWLSIPLNERMFSEQDYSHHMAMGIISKLFNFFSSHFISKDKENKIWSDNSCVIIIHKSPQDKKYLKIKKPSKFKVESRTQQASKFYDGSNSYITTGKLRNKLNSSYLGGDKMDIGNKRKFSTCKLLMSNDSPNNNPKNNRVNCVKNSSSDNVLKKFLKLTFNYISKKYKNIYNIFKNKMIDIIIIFTITFISLGVPIFLCIYGSYITVISLSCILIFWHLILWGFRGLGREGALSSNGEKLISNLAIWFTNMSIIIRLILPIAIGYYIKNPSGFLGCLDIFLNIRSIIFIFIVSLYSLELLNILWTCPYDKEKWLNWLIKVSTLVFFGVIMSILAKLFTDIQPYLKKSIFEEGSPNAGELAESHTQVSDYENLQSSNSAESKKKSFWLIDKMFGKHWNDKVSCNTTRPGMRLMLTRLGFKMEDSNVAGLGEEISMFERAAYKYNPFKSSSNSNVPLLSKMQLNNNLRKYGILYVEKGYMCFNKIITLSEVKYMAYIRYKPYKGVGWYAVLKRLDSSVLTGIKFKDIKELALLVNKYFSSGEACHPKWDEPTTVPLREDKWEVETTVPLREDKWDKETLVNLSDKGDVNTPEEELEIRDSLINLPEGFKEARSTSSTPTGGSDYRGPIKKKASSRFGPKSDLSAQELEYLIREISNPMVFIFQDSSQDGDGNYNENRIDKGKGKAIQEDTTITQGSDDNEDANRRGNNPFRANISEDRREEQLNEDNLNKALSLSRQEHQQYLNPGETAGESSSMGEARRNALINKHYIRCTEYISECVEWKFKEYYKDNNKNYTDIIQDYEDFKTLIHSIFPEWWETNFDFLTKHLILQTALNKIQGNIKRGYLGEYPARFRWLNQHGMDLVFNRATAAKENGELTENFTLHYNNRVVKPRNGVGSAHLDLDFIKLMYKYADKYPVIDYILGISQELELSIIHNTYLENTPQVAIGYNMVNTGNTAAQAPQAANLENTGDITPNPEAVGSGGELLATTSGLEENDRNYTDTNLQQANWQSLQDNQNRSDAASLAGGEIFANADNYDSRWLRHRVRVYDKNKKYVETLETIISTFLKYAAASAYSESIFRHRFINKEIYNDKYYFITEDGNLDSMLDKTKKVMRSKEVLLTDKDFKPLRTFYSINKTALYFNNIKDGPKRKQIESLVVNNEIFLDKYRLKLLNDVSEVEQLPAERQDSNSEDAGDTATNPAAVVTEPNNSNIATNPDMGVAPRLDSTDLSNFQIPQGSGSNLGGTANRPITIDGNEPDLRTLEAEGEPYGCG
jgi:hypothetical protein